MTRFPIVARIPSPARFTAAKTHSTPEAGATASPHGVCLELGAFDQDPAMAASATRANGRSRALIDKGDLHAT
jgi:hypothetical protein